MAVFQYKAKKMDGTTVSGIIDAADQEVAIVRLRGDGLYVYWFQLRDASTRVIGNSKINLKLMTAFCSQMSAMLKVGIPAAKALELCGQSASDRKLKTALKEVSENVQKGMLMSQAMLELKKLFPLFLIYMTETGETSGTLDQIMAKMAVHYEREVQLKGKIQTAMIYPGILAVVTVIATVFMLMMVFPQFAPMFSEMELPFATRMLMAISSGLNQYWIHLLFGTLLVVALYSWMMTKEAFCRLIHSWILQMPVIGALIKTIYTSRFASAFSILYGSGVDVLNSLDISSRVLTNSYFRMRLQKASLDLRTGAMLSEALKDAGVFKPDFISMVRIGEESGSLDQILFDTGVFFEKEANTAMTRLIALLEPCMILLMGGIIGFIVLAIMLPIFEMYGHIV